MKSKFLFVFLFLGILNCEAQHFNAIPYDYLQLALRWPNSYCLTHEGGCREIVPQYVTISYLHPMRRGGADLQNCPSPFNMPNSTDPSKGNDVDEIFNQARQLGALLKGLLISFRSLQGQLTLLELAALRGNYTIY
ncbi:hypothetical protein JHK87_001606 [Glycine soja]|nr:hypothetical protein JHK87_001606 [Glycine soja]